jgi:DNA-binding CsgD family transcriptional regulator
VAHAFEAELLERESELDTVRALVAGAFERNGALALVEGPAGIGKSSLLKEAAAEAKATGFETASARASELERDFAFGLVRQLFEPKLAEVDARSRKRLFAGAAGLAAPLFEPLDAESLSPRGEASHATLHGLYWLATNLAGERPLALTVDDAHWGDAPSLRFLAYLANRVDGLPVFMMMGARPAEPGAEADLLEELATGPSTRVIRPRALSRDGVRELVEAALGEAHPSFVDACFEATHGNPMMLDQLLLTVTQEGLTPTAENADGVLKLASRSIARSVGLRMSRLGADAEAVGRAVAVLGDGTTLGLAASLAGLTPDAAGEASEALAGAEILQPDVAEFVHPVVRAAVYGQLRPAERACRHRAAAELLAEQDASDDEVALHLLPARPDSDAWVVDVLRRAARRAHSRGAPDVAATYLERALSEPPEGTARAGILVELGQAELAVNRLHGLVRLREAVELTTDPQERARVSLALGSSLFLWLDFPGAADVLERALADVPEDEPALRDEVEAQFIAACAIDPTLRPKVAVRMVELLQDNASVSDPTLLATLALSAAVFTEPAATGVALAERALADGRLSVEEQPMVVAMAGVALMAGDRLEEAERVWDRALADALRHGALYAAGFVLTVRAMVRARMGAMAAAEADAGAALEKLPEGADAQLRWILPPLIDALVERGELESASAILKDHSTVWEHSSQPVHFLLDSVGRLCLARREVDQAIAHLRDCGRQVEAWGIQNPGLVPWRASLAEALVAAGQREEAIEVAREAIRLARLFEVPRELGMALRAAGLAESGEAGIELLQEAVTVLEPSQARLEHARALTDLGAALRRASQRAAAREHLRAGLDLAQRCDATVLAERAHSELVATGARPRRLVLSGVASLTASERRVAEMASEGMTNREIAQALFVTEKTVEGHLGHAYAKLDISSRAELPQALVRAPEPSVQ